MGLLSSTLTYMSAAAMDIAGRPRAGVFAADLIFGLPKSLILVLTAAFAYAIATFGIKLASGAVSPLATGLILFGFLLAAAAETVLLRQSDLGAIYLAIIAVETIVILTIAAVIGEGLNLKQFFGAGLILGGIVLVGH